MKKDIISILTDNCGKDITAIAVTTLNFWAGIKLTQSFRRMETGTVPADIDAILAEEVEDVMAIIGGNEIQALPDMRTAADLVYATYLIGVDLISYSEVNPKTGIRTYPYKWLRDAKKRFQTPTEVLVANSSFVIKRNIDEFAAKLSGRGTPEQRTNALTKYTRHQAALAAEPLKAKLAEMTPLVEMSMRDWSREDLAIKIEALCEDLDLNAEQLVQEATQRKWEMDEERALSGKFIGDDSQVREFLGIEMHQKTSNLLPDDDLDELFKIV